MNLYDIHVQDMEKAEVSLENYKGKVLLIINTATACGFTPQYNGLQNLYKTYKEQGLEILDFPCNQFAGQAPGNEEEIHDFCQMRYKITFKQFAKIDVNGENESPLYTYLKKQKGGVFGSKIKWNFTKFLVDREGNVVGRYGSADKPEKLGKIIAGLL
jgi:glutathione peroxidase